MAATAAHGDCRESFSEAIGAGDRGPDREAELPAPSSSALMPTGPLNAPSYCMPLVMPPVMS